MPPTSGADFDLGLRRGQCSTGHAREEWKRRAKGLIYLSLTKNYCLALYGPEVLVRRPLSRW